MDKHVWISHFSTFLNSIGNSIGINPAFVFVALIMAPLLFLAWWVNAKKDRELTAKLYEIRIDKLPEQIEFYTRSSSPVLLAVCGLIGAYLFWRFDVLWFQEKVYFPLSYAIIMGLMFLAQYETNRFVYKPLIVLSREGFKYRSKFYTWDEIATIEVLHFSRSPDQFVVKLKQGMRWGNMVCNISPSSLKQPWLPQYANEYFLRYRKNKQ